MIRLPEVNTLSAFFSSSSCQPINALLTCEACELFQATIKERFTLLSLTMNIHLDLLLFFRMFAEALVDSESCHSVTDIVQNSYITEMTQLKN